MTFGELSVVRSFGRLLIPLSGIGLILWMLYAGTVWMERLFLLHRQAGLVTVCAALVHGYGLLLGRFGATPSPRTVKTA